MFHCMWVCREAVYQTCGGTEQLTSWMPIVKTETETERVRQTQM